MAMVVMVGGGGRGGIVAGGEKSQCPPLPLYEILVRLPTTASAKDCQWADCTCSRHHLETPCIVVYFSKQN